MRLLNRLREREIMRIGDPERQPDFAIGAIWEDPKTGERWRITRHKLYPTTPWSTYVVYAVRA